jgi:hypothetical protein
MRAGKRELSVGVRGLHDGARAIRPFTARVFVSAFVYLQLTADAQIGPFAHTDKN